jgi:hypothetical protein
MEIRKATQEDMAFVRQNPFEGAVKNYPYMEVPDENTYTAIYESAIVAVGGLQVKWEGVGLLWLMLTADCKKYGVFGLIALEAIKEKMEFLIEENNLWRAEAVIRTGFPQAIKMIEFFGFEREGLMRQYMPDKSDGYLYSRIF